MNKTYLGLGIVAVVAIGLGSYYLGAKNESPKPGAETPGSVVCTADAMQCPDGSYVGRTGPNCQFVCPNTPKPAPVVKASNTAKLGERVSFNGLYITPLKVTEDSRCPADVQCVWAGRVVLSAKLERNGKTQEAIFDSSKQNVVTFEGKSISLSKVGAKENYTFTFSSN
ncbi:hypothetical protein KW784_01765 [Candidatus Parcubacteria bacterium]|nr:hypothetical protein [Candidatus Parcubacteria bacterium]